MENLRVNPSEAQFSSRFLSRFSPLRRQPDQANLKKEPEMPHHRIIYNRSGNLATTQLDQEKADRFMRVADMRRDIVIVDSDTPPERNYVSVSSDTLAFRLVELIRRLTEVRFRPKPFHVLVRRDDHFELQVLERAIDDKIRSGHPIDSSDYNEKFLRMLNGAVSAGNSEIVTSEKLGLPDQMYPYITYGMILAGHEYTAAIDQKTILQWAYLFVSLGQFVGFNALSHASARGNEYYLTKHPFIRRTPYECLIPLMFPLDRWVRGEIFLARNGTKMVIQKPSQETPKP